MSLVQLMYSGFFSLLLSGLSFEWRFAFRGTVLAFIICFLIFLLPSIGGRQCCGNHSFYRANLLKNRKISALLIITTLWLATHYIVYSGISSFMSGTGDLLINLNMSALNIGIGPDTFFRRHHFFRPNIRILLCI